MNHANQLGHGLLPHPMMTESDPFGTVRAVAKRHTELARLLTAATRTELTQPSLLPGWDRLTIACHLRYGAEASLTMTEATLAGREVSFYPGGRAALRPSTLAPRPGESPSDVITDLVTACTRLDALWNDLTSEQWGLIAQEPSDNRDLGAVGLTTLALLRLTEVEVHGTDLDIGAEPWSRTFVDQALPMRLRWLPTRRSNDSPADHAIAGTWIFRSNDGGTHVIAIDEGGVSVHEGEATGRAELTGSNGELLAFMLGRLDLGALVVDGDADFAADFLRAFPAP